MNYWVYPSTCLHGDVRVPSDKSISHRALLLGALAHGETVIEGLLISEDVLATAHALTALGIPIERTPKFWRITGQPHQWQQPQQALDCGNSGTTMRLLTGCLAGKNISACLIGDNSLSRRPMERIAEPLRQMGAAIRLSPQATAPIQLSCHSGLTGIDYHCPIASAQVKSALLLAGLNARSLTSIHEPMATRDHTERMLQAFGVELSLQGQQLKLLGPQSLNACSLKIPADISSAAFFMVAASITPGADITLTEVGVNPSRSGIIQLLQAMGAAIELSNFRYFGQEPVADIRIRHAPLQGITVPTELIANAIDEFPVLFIAAANAQGQTVLRRASELRHKESDRLASMAEGFKSLGIPHQLYDDGISIWGSPYPGGQVNSYGDHRIAMAFAIAALTAQSPMLIEDVANVASSFPNFIELAQQLGIIIQAA